MGRSYKELSIIMLGIVVGTVFAFLSITFMYIKEFDLITVSFFVFFVSLLMLWTIYSINQRREEKFISATKREWMITSSGVIGGTLLVILSVYLGSKTEEIIQDAIFFVMLFVWCFFVLLFLIFNEWWEKSIPVDTEKKILIENSENMINLLETFRSQYNKENTKIYYGMNSIDFFYDGGIMVFIWIFAAFIAFLGDRYFRNLTETVTGFVIFLILFIGILFLLVRFIIVPIFKYIGEKRKDRILRESHPVLRYKLYSPTIGIFNENRYILVFDFSENCVYEIVRESSKISEKMSNIIKNVHGYLCIT